MYPLQGHWSVDDYLALDTGILVEYTDGFVEVLPRPTIQHQLIVKFIFRNLDDHMRTRSAGEVLLAPLPVRLTPARFREPDILLARPERLKDLQGYPDGADLVIEVVNEGKESRQRDYVDKRREYAAAGIAEYWIVDPQERKITVLVLGDAGQNEYEEHGVFRRQQTVTSRLLPDFTLDVDQTFAKCTSQL